MFFANHQVVFSERRKRPATQQPTTTDSHREKPSKLSSQIPRRNNHHIRAFRYISICEPSTERHSYFNMTQYHFLRLKYQNTARAITTISPQAPAYPYFQLNSGIT